MPPPPLTYSNGGGAGSREHNLICGTIPQQNWHARPCRVRLKANQRGLFSGHCRPTKKRIVKPKHTYHDWFTNFLLGNSITDTFEILIESTLKTNHQFYTSFITGIDGLNSFGEISSDGLFAEYVLSIGGGRLNLISMEWRGGANPDGINLRVGNNIHGIICEAWDIELGSSWICVILWWVCNTQKS